MKTNIKHIFFLGLALMLSLSSQAQTFIKGGNVSGEWSKAGSPYIIEDHIKVPKDSLLKISEGVQVKFYEDVYMLVEGRIMAIGKKNEEIIFTENNPSKAWAGIVMINVTDSVHFSYCKVSRSDAQLVKKVNGQDTLVNGRTLYAMGVTSYFSTKVYFDHCDFSHNTLSVAPHKSKVYIDNCNFHDHYSTYNPPYRGAVQQDSSYFEITNSVFQDSESDLALPILAGGTRYSEQSANSVVKNCVFQNLKECTPSAGALDYINCTFKNNFARQGGGLKVGRNSTSLIKGCLFENNAATAYGSAIQFLGNCSKVVVDSCEFRNNGFGVAILFREMAGSPTIKNSKFFGNQGAIGDNDGSSNALIFNCLFANNKSTIGAFGRSKYINCTVVNNDTRRIDGDPQKFWSGIVVGPKSTAEFINCLVWGNNDSFNNQTQIYIQKSSSKPIFKNCIIQHGLSGFQLGSDSSQSFNGTYTDCLDQDPGFADTTKGDYQLKNTCSEYSIAYNKGYTGDLSAYFDSTSIDLNGKPRKVGDTLDIGAFEIQGLKSRFWIKTQPKDQSVCQDDSAKLNIQTTGLEVRQEWEQSTDQGKSWQRAGSQDKKLLLAKAQQSDSGNLYRVILVNTCQYKDTTRQALLQVHPAPIVDLGPDSSIDQKSSMTLRTIKVQGHSYTWSDGSSKDTLVLKGADLALGQHDIWVEVRSKEGCSSTDSMQLTVTKVDNIALMAKYGIKAYPNPVENQLNIECQTKTRVRLISPEGKELQNVMVQAHQPISLDLEWLNTSWFILELETEQRIIRTKVVKR